ncbi:MAG: hypothetical protein II404_14660 [Prevotella sp.]|nr:hypothetical protein [Prevotella sp.]
MAQNTSTEQNITKGTCLQYHRIPTKRLPSPGGKRRWYRIRFEGGTGGDAASNLPKGHVSAVIPAWAILAAIYNEYDFDVASIVVGDADSSIASAAEAIICIPSGEPAEFVKSQQESMNQWLQEEYGQHDPQIHCTIEKCEKQETVIDNKSFESLMECLEQIPQGMIADESKKGNATASNNVGRIRTEQDYILVSTLSIGPTTSEANSLAQDIKSTFASFGATSETVQR